MMTKKLLLAIAILLGVNCAAHADTRCARLESGAVVEYRTFDAMYAKIAGVENNGCPSSIPSKGVTWLPAPDTRPPAYDAATQVLTGPTITIGADQVTTSYSVRDKTAQELADEADAAKEARLNSVDLFVLKTLCDHESRIRVLEGKSAITLTQCRAAIKAALQ